MISPAFVEANYEVLESLLRERRKHIRNEDLRTELEYFSEEYDEEREMESRLERARETTLVHRTRSPRARRQRERVVKCEKGPNREGGRVGRNAEGGRPSKPEANTNKDQGINLPPLLAAHLRRNKNGQPPQSSLTSVYGGHQPSTNIRGNLPLMVRISLIMVNLSYPVIYIHLMDLYLPMLILSRNQLGNLRIIPLMFRMVTPLLGEPQTNTCKEGTSYRPFPTVIRLHIVDSCTQRPSLRVTTSSIHNICMHNQVCHVTP
nr:hypothetical protein [Tanacetum cinerariifolium]